MREDLLALAERCEAATGPDATLNADILEALKDERWRQLEYEASLPCGAPPDMIRKEARYKAGIRFPFTASLDAAMTLAKDFGGEVTFFRDGTAKSFLWQPYPMAISAKASTPALALCAAALRALASKEDKHD